MCNLKRASLNRQLPVSTVGARNGPGSKYGAAPHLVLAGRISVLRSLRRLEFGWETTAATRVSYLCYTVRLELKYHNVDTSLYLLYACQTN